MSTNVLSKNKVIIKLAYQLNFTIEKKPKIGEFVDVGKTNRISVTKNQISSHFISFTGIIIIKFASHIILNVYNSIIYGSPCHYIHIIITNIST